MSKTTIIYAHPYEKSFNHAILERVQALLDAKGQEYRLIDLYADGFNPVYTKEELALFREGKGVVAQGRLDDAGHFPASEVPWPRWKAMVEPV